MRERRALLAAARFLPGLLLASCARDAPPPRVEGPPIGYDYLPRLRLDVADIAFEDRSPIAGPRDLGRELRPTAVEAVSRMGRDRLAAAGAQGAARFAVTRATILPDRLPARGGLLAGDAGERLSGEFACRLEILDANGRAVAFAEATTQRTRTAESNPAARRAGAESLLRLAVFDLNAEFEFQLRRSLRPYLVEGAGAAPPGPVQREALPPA